MTAPPAGGALVERLAGVRERIAAAAGGDAGRVAIVAVTKGFGPEVVAEALGAGLDDVGENYAQELLAKAAGAGGDRHPRWHFLGAPQRNKMAALAPVVTLWQAVDRVAVVDRLAALRPGAALLVQVNVAEDPAKAGCPVDDTAAVVDRARQAGLDVRGLMCVAPAGAGDDARRCFATLRSLGSSLDVAELSMGMSDDFEAAVAEGSTMVRLGRVLFGPRPGRAGVRR